MSIDVLTKKIKEKNNPTVAGLDPKLDYVPKHIKEKNFKQFGKTAKAAAASIFEFNCGLIDALCDVVPAVKPQSAYYEMLGPSGAAVFKDTIDYAKGKGLYVIADVKRNDIGSTAEAYAAAYLGYTEIEGEKIAPYGADSATVNAYLGTDGIEPFLKICKGLGKSIFVLVKTSNKSSGEFQNRDMEGKPLYERVAEMMNEWSKDLMTPCGYSEVGAVVGATYPEEQKRLRALLPNAYFLVPGYGAQGASASDIKNAFDKNGMGAIVNSSRAIMCAWKKTDKNGEDYMDAARKEAVRMRDEIMSVL